MLPDYSVKHVPGLYPRPPSPGCCCQCDRPLWSRITFCVVALQQNPVSLAGWLAGSVNRSTSTHVSAPR